MAGLEDGLEIITGRTSPILPGEERRFAMLATLHTLAYPDYASRIQQLSILSRYCGDRPPWRSG